jgi:multiple sugar transport system permease protein/sn-glycerol 3-phosphate transport system permease protein
LGLFYLYPLVQTVVFSFTDWNPLDADAPRYLGAENYRSLVTGDSFMPALGHTLVFVVFTVPLTLGFGLFLAALLDRPFRGRAVYRVLIFAPFVAPTVGSALIFSYLLTPLGGLVNGALAGFGVEPIAFLVTSPWAMVSVIVFSIWHQVGYAMLIYSSALSAVPRSYHEAAKLDGAGAFRRFFALSVPLVQPTTVFLTITGILSSLQVFTQIQVLTHGGPLGSTTTALYWIYEQGFSFFHGGLASAAAVILLLIGVAVTLVQLVLADRRRQVELI